jgi:hypothetical protein
MIENSRHPVTISRITECAFHIRDGRHWTAEYGIERKIELLKVAVVKFF